MSEAKRVLLEKLGKQKLRELLDKIDDLEIALDVIKEELEKIREDLPKTKIRKTKQSNSEA